MGTSTRKPALVIDQRCLCGQTLILITANVAVASVLVLIKRCRSKYCRDTLAGSLIIPGFASETTAHHWAALGGSRVLRHTPRDPEI